MCSFNKVVMIGAGNVATCLSKYLHKIGIEILQIYSRHVDSAIDLAETVGAKIVNHYSDINQDADLYIIAVSDDAIGQVAHSLLFQPKWLVHTSGSVSLNTIEGCAKHCGVLYPMQTMSKAVEVDLSNATFCVESTNPTDEKVLTAFMKTLSPLVYPMTSKQRESLHLAAVFVNNFTNHMFAISSEILQHYGLPFSLMHSLIEETCRKAIGSDNPKTVQTGPAKRQDHSVINKHIDKLKFEPQWQSLYKLISESIIDLDTKL